MQISYIGNIIMLFWIHFIADFLFQPETMAAQKHRSFKWLGIHSLIYGICFIYFGLKFAVITGILHLIVDGITSRCTNFLQNAGYTRWTLRVIGLDQAIHMNALVVTYNLL